MNDATPFLETPLRPKRLLNRHAGGLDFAIGDLLAVAALGATFAAVICLFAISPITLESKGIGYLSSGGGALAKAHPATFLAVAAVALRCLATPSPLRTGWRLLSGDTGIVLLTAAIAVAGVFAVFIDKTPVTPLVDTFMLPIVVLVLLRDLDGRVARWLAILVAAILVANSIIAIAEFLRGWRLIPINIPDEVTADPTSANATFSWQAELSEDWRATAILGHPLVNGLIAGAFMICLAAPSASWLPLILRVPMIVLQGASMFTLRARSALVLTAILCLWLLISEIAGATAAGARFQPRQIAVVLLAAAILVVGLALLNQTGFLDRTIERFTNDSGSATTRLTMFSLLDPISWSDLVLKPDKDLVATWQRMYGLEFGIESSWLGLVLTYGLVVSAMLIAGLIAFAGSVARRSARGGGVVLLLYFILVSGSATLSGKTTTFAMTVALIMLFLRSVPPSPSARRVRSV